MLDLDNLKIEKEESSNQKFYFSYDGKRYYYKTIKRVEDYYNEIVAMKIAQQLEISCCEYFLGSLDGFLGVASLVFPREHYQSMNDFLISIYGEEEIFEKNNLQDIRNAFLLTFPNSFEELSSTLNQIFLFDALIGNADRNIENYGLIVEEESVHFAPLFDHENMLSDFAIYDGNYTLGVDREDYHNSNRNPVNILYKALDQEEILGEQLLKMLPVIEEENLQKIFQELEKENEINPYIKERILKRFSQNREMIKQYFQKKKIYQK